VSRAYISTISLLCGKLVSTLVQINASWCK
jgi:hypothetical protein